MMKNKGFSLIEMMVVVVIIGILTIVAYPYYRQNVLTSNRIEAKSSLMELSQLQENFFVENNRYATNFTENELNAAQAGFARDGGNFVSINPNLDLINGYYQLNLIGTNATYTLTATATGSQTEDTNCIIFTINHVGQKTATDNTGQPNDKCW
ncbi:type IV pilin protein [Candidatus Halobeggiatoa sp. HSG11]|nr:type IV pilin protein [Candidatus Halobeggiatoa sp. HSG11]